MYDPDIKKWEATVGVGLARADARKEEKDYWKDNNPNDRFMVKKYIATALMIGFILMVVSAAEKGDTVAGNQIILSKQTMSQALSKTSTVKPVRSSNWSKIKDLFM